MEVPLCSGEIRRRGFCIILSVLPHYYGPTGYDYGVCSRACQQKKYYKKLCAVGKRGDKVAFARLCRFGGQLLPDDVLYYGSGLDAVLFLLDADRAVYRSRCGGSGADIRRYVGKTGSYGRVDAFSGCGRFWNLFRRFAERCGTYDQGDDGSASGDYASAGFP